MTVKEVTHAYQLQRWAELVADCKSSGKSIASWCAEQGLNSKTYYYWQRKVRERALGQMTVCQGESLQTASRISAPSFAEYKISTQSTSSAAVTLHLNCGTLEIHNNADQAIIESTLRALRSIC